MVTANIDTTVRDINYPEIDDEKLKRQLELEQEGIEIGIKRYRERKKERKESNLPTGIALMNKAIEPVIEGVKKLKQKKRGGQRVHATRKLIKQVGDEELAYIIAKTCINHVTEPIQLQNLAVRLTNIIINHIEYKKFKAENPNYLNAMLEDLNQRTAHTRHRKNAILHAKRKLGIEDTDWSIVDRAYTGAKLIEIFIEYTGLAQRKQMRDSSWMLDGTDKVKEWIEDKHAQCELLEPEFLPMIVPPKDWEDPYSGGYLSSDTNLRTKLVKTRNNEALELLEEHNDELSEVYDALNAIQQVPWRINEKIYNVMSEAWNIDNGLGELPTNKEEPLPPKPWGMLDDDEFEKYKKENPEVVKRWKARAKDVYYRRTKQKSKRYQISKKLWIAKKFKDEDAIYFPYVLDWRGRVYPSPNHVNPQNDDVSKSLIEFADGKPLGESGAKWLQINLANKFGKDKISFDERIEWVNEHHDEILKSAEDPYRNRFWEEADDPWQFLANCFEYKGYIEEGTDYVSHLPVNVDGSCNGLQNFSGMLKDREGGEYVNLTPSDQPQDLYQVVADKVEDRLKDSTSRFAPVWREKVTRDIVKRPVMTTPYGVTKRGMKDQLIEKLRDLDENESYLGRNIDNYKASRYLAGKIQNAIDDTVSGASEAMDWLQETAKVANQADEPFWWKNPVGFRPLQYYIKQNTKRLDTYWGKARVRVRLSVNVDDQDDKLNKRKQVNGVAPNFVHSYDSAHLMKSVLKAKRNGIDYFSVIHDSFGSHAGDMDDFHRIIKETFVDMYTNHNPLKEFEEDIKEQIPEELHDEISERPELGNLNLSEVLKSAYFFA